MPEGERPVASQLPALCAGPTIISRVWGTIVMDRVRALLVNGIAAAVLAIGAICGPANAQEGSGSTARVASVTYGPYFRIEAGMFDAAFDEAFWQSGAGDPLVGFDLNGGPGGFGSLAIGYDWQNGIRMEAAVLRTGEVGLSGPCSSASDGTSCSTHADITAGSFQTTAALANFYLAPLEAAGRNYIFQPFLVAGLGVAYNETGDWTRTNLASARPVRTFAGDSHVGFAWSVGVGASLQVTRPGAWPIIVDAAWRYYDFGTATGGSTVVAGGGADTPTQPLQFDAQAHVFSVGIRIPLQRY